MDTQTFIQIINKYGFLEAKNLERLIALAPHITDTERQEIIDGIEESLKNQNTIIENALIPLTKKTKELSRTKREIDEQIDRASETLPNFDEDG